MDHLKLDLSSWKFFFTLYKLADLGASSRTVKVSTEYWQKKLEPPSRLLLVILLTLEKMGWITRTVTVDGCLTKLTPQGVSELKKLYSELRLIFESEYPPSITLEGVVVQWTWVRVPIMLLKTVTVTSLWKNLGLIRILEPLM